MDDPSAQARAELLTHVLDGPGEAPGALRRQAARGDVEGDPALRELLRKVRDQAYRVTDEELQALRARHTEDALFELIVATALGAAEARMARALRAIEEA